MTRIVSSRRELVLRQPAERADRRLQMPRQPGAHRLRSFDRRRGACAGSSSFSPALRRRHVLDDAAAFEPHAAHREMLEQIDVVARDQHRDADFVEAAEDLHHFQRQVRIEVAGRLVGDEDRRLAHDRARDADALLLAGRQLQRHALLAPEQADLIERRAHALADFLGADAGDDQRQRDVVEDRAVVQQLVILEHHADLAPERRHLARDRCRRRSGR